MTKVPAHERRAQLIAAASRVISREGVLGATTRAIAREAGANQAAIHYVFGSKENLFTALLQWSIANTEATLSEARIARGAGLERAVTELMLTHREVDPSIIFAEFDLLLWSIRTPDLANEASELYTRLRSIVSSSLERAAKEDEGDVDFDYLAKLLLINADGTQFGMLCTGRDYADCEDDTAALASMLIQLARSRHRRHN